MKLSIVICGWHFKNEHLYRKLIKEAEPYKGRISPKHLSSFDEQGFSKYSSVEIKLSKRKGPKGAIKTDMMVIIKK